MGSECFQFEKKPVSIDSTHNLPSLLDSKNNCSVCCKMCEVELRSHIQKENSGKETDEPIKKEVDASDCVIGSEHSHSAVEGCEKLNEKFSCSKCFYSTDRKGDLNRHMLTHTGERPHQCELCNKTFTQRCSLTRHFLIHKGEQPYVGDTYGKSFPTKLTLRPDEETHPEESPYPFVCDTCGRGFSKKSCLRHHGLMMKGKCHLSRLKEGDQKFRCTECPYATDCQDNLKKHLTMKGKCHLSRMKEGGRKFRCTECPYAADRKDSLKQHLVIHSGERPHQCELCNKTFSLKANLMKHILVHTGERPYVCDACGKGFREQSSLHRHKLTMKGKCHLSRLKEGHQKYRCTECPYSSNRSYHLKKHLMTHSGERPHQCELCGKTFSIKSSMKRHYLVHTGEKPYVCHTCGKGFSLSSSLHYHEVRQHKVSQGTSSLITRDSDPCVPMPSNELCEASSKVKIETNALAHCI